MVSMMIPAAMKRPASWAAGREALPSRLHFRALLRRAGLALLCTCGLLVPAPSSAQEKTKRKAPRQSGEAGGNEKEPCPGKRVKTAQATYRHYTVRVYRSTNSNGCFEILHDGRRALAQNGFLFSIGGSAVAADESSSRVKMGTDVTGEGQPDLVMGEWTGGAHCCFRLRVYEIGEKFRQVADLDLKDTSDPQIADLDGDGKFELVIADWTFSYWHTSFADSPAPQVILRFRDSAFHLAADLMRTAPPPPAELEAKARQVRDHAPWTEGSDPPVALWGAMLDLIYGGNAKLAWTFLDDAWPAARPGKEKFLQEFRAQLAASPYWTDLQALNGAPAS